MIKAKNSLKNNDSYKKNLQNIALSTVVAVILSACAGGGRCGNCIVPGVETSQLIFVAPSILPSLANKTGINYMGVYNPSDVDINGISYSVGQQVGSGNSITMDQASAKTCANIIAKSSCYLKFSVSESTIAGGAVVTASNSDGSEAATPLAIGVQQVLYIESANANGIGLYFYSKAQYSESGVPFILVTAVVQSPNLGTINTIELVDESGNVIPDQIVTSGNSGAGSLLLVMGDVVEIALPLPQGVNLTQNMKVQTSYKTATVSSLNSIVEKLNLKNPSLKATTNKSTGSVVYSVTTQQSNNINLQFTPNQVYLTRKNSIQYGYLYNIGDITASQIQVNSSSPDVKVTVAEQTLGKQKVAKITYELLGSDAIPASNPITITAQNPSGQIETATGTSNQNVNPDIVPTPTPSPTPTPGPAPTPVPAPGNLTLTSPTNFIQLGNMIQVTVKLENSFGVTTAIPVSVNCNSSNINCSLATSCNLTTTNNSCQITIQGNYLGNGALIATTTTSGYESVGGFYTVGSSSDGSQNLYAPFKTGTYPNLTTTLNRCLVSNSNIISGCSNQNSATGLGGYSYVYNMTLFNPDASNKYLYIPSRAATNTSYVYKCAVANDGTLGTACSDASNGSFSLGNLIEAGMVAQNINGQSYLFLGDGVAGKIYRCNMANNGDLSSCSLGFDFNTVGNSAITGIRLWNISGNLYLYAQGIIGKVYRCSVSQIDASISACTEVHQFNTPSPLTSMAFLQLNNHSYAYVSYLDSSLDPAPAIVEECTVDNLGGFTDCSLTNASFTAPVDSGTYGSLNSLTSVAKNNQVYLYAQYQILDGYGIPTGNTSFEQCLINTPSNLSCSNSHTYANGVFTFSLF